MSPFYFLSHYLYFMNKLIFIKWIGLIFCGVVACRNSGQPDPLPEPVLPESFYYKQLAVNDIPGQLSYNSLPARPVIRINFSAPLNTLQLKDFISLSSATENVPLLITATERDSALTIQPVSDLDFLARYTFKIQPDLKSAKGTPLNTTIQISLFTAIDSTDKFPRISDDDLLTLLQRQTFRYFWDFAHPVSGLARERNTSGDIVTSGGSGFGIMAFPAAIERGFISRAEGYERLLKITDFLTGKADRFHGAFPHWLNGATGKAVAFSQKDDGADLVETSFLIQGLLTARAYFDRPEEAALRSKITTLWEEVEWNWFTKNGEKVLYWHWSPQYQWEMNLPIRGWNECLITYVLAAASSTFPISREVYDQGFAANGQMKNGNTYYGYRLPLGRSTGGPLFFSHYSFLGLDPRGLNDAYASYSEQVINHTRINYAYCVANPKQFNGYSPDCWGLTASDSHNGYSAHAPDNDLGVISPTAALSSIAYTPEESLRALRFFYYKLGDKLWGEYGIKDAFNLSVPWFASSYLAIDQAPVIVMTENYRTGLIWKLFMSDKEVERGLQRLGFVDSK